MPDHTALVRTLYEAYNRRDFNYAVSLVTEDFEMVNVAAGNTFYGPEGYRSFLQGWSAAFPDSWTEIENVIASGDQVVVEFTGRGTHGGPFHMPEGEIPPTGRTVAVPFCDVWQMRDGKAARSRSYFDVATFMQQLGIVPTAATAGVGS